MRQNFREAYRETRWAVLKRRYQGGGVWFALRSSWRGYWIRAMRTWLHFWLNVRPAKTFVVRNETYRYFVHKYNTTWANERAVEVPIVRRLLERNVGKRVLEVGHVLGHYGVVHHDVLDKYEGAPGVICQDVTVFKPESRYDLVVSISTLEHVGFDEDVQDSGKILDAIDNLCRNCLSPGGLLIFTVPVGWNPHLDRLLTESRLPLDMMTCLQRTGPMTWRESSWEEVQGATYDDLARTANAVIVGHVRAARASEASSS